MPYRSVRVSVLATKRLGFWKPLNIIILVGAKQTTENNRLSCQLLRIQFDDELLVQLDLNQVAPLRQGSDFARQTFPVDVDPVRRRRMRCGVARSQNGGILFAAFPYRDGVANPDQGGWNVALAAVDVNVAVAYDLAGLGAAGAETHPVNHAVQAAFERAHQVLAGDAFGGRRLFIGAAELCFQHAVNAAHLLLFAELQAVADDLLFAVLTMLPGDEIALFDGALLAVAALAFEIKFHALAPALPANGANISCQVPFPTFRFRCGLQPWQAFIPLVKSFQPSAISFQLKIGRQNRPHHQLTAP